MDLYSSLRVLQKRWRVAVPLLLLTLIGVAVAVSQASASKQATGEVVLLAAPTPPNPTNENPNPPVANNPYALMELPDVVDVISRSVLSEATGRVLDREGLSGSYTIGGNQDFQRGPIITIEATSSTEQSALRSYRLVEDEAQATLDRLQDQVGANPAFRVKMQRVTAPTVSTASTLVELRAALIALVVGLFITLTVVFGVESIVRGQARRRTAHGAGHETGPTGAAEVESADGRTGHGADPAPALPVVELAPSSRSVPLGDERQVPNEEDLEAERRRQTAARRRAKAARRRQAQAARVENAEPTSSPPAPTADGNGQGSSVTAAPKASTTRKPRPRKPTAASKEPPAASAGPGEQSRATGNGHQDGQQQDQQEDHQAERAAPGEGS